MTDSSDCESDAGASPSVSSDDTESSSSSRCSSPTGLKIVTPSCSNVSPPIPATPRRKSSTLAAQNNSVTFSSTPDTSFFSSSGFCSTPLSSVRKPARRRQLITSSDTPVAGAACKPSTSRGTQSDLSRTSVSSSGIATPGRKRKRPSSTSPSTASKALSSSAEPVADASNLLCSPEKKPKRSKRRRTRSERNLLAGKAATTAVATPVVKEGEEVVALDAEIDRVLEEKALKSNLTAKNVKSIIHHVMTDNLVQKMFMSVVKKKADQQAGGDGDSSDEFGLVEPKMTRAKTKELMGSNKKILWPIVDSPVKISKQPVSETHILIHNDLPEDSSGDEEYIPKGTTPLSDDESSSVASSRNSDIGSPASKPGVLTRRSVQSAQNSPFNDTMFKTPPPKQKPKALRKKEEESAISLRTRSKLPLNDTPLEDLERQLVPPDITKDMYDWGTDNEDYLAFLKDFLNPGQNQNDANEQDDDAADPEYNVMEDFEDEHDREELRMDRAVKVPKKELTQLIAELFEAGGMLSGDELDDHDLATLTGITPLVNDSGYTAQDSTLNSTAQTVDNTTLDTSQAVEANPIPATPQNYQETEVVMTEPENNDLVNVIKEKEDEEPTWLRRRTESIPSGQRAVSSVDEGQTLEVIYQPPYFRDCDLKRLHHQIRQHLQLLAQSYVMTVSSEDACLKNITKSAKTMVIEVKNFARMYGESSNFAVCNLDAAWTLVNLWPHKILNQSPIKKKILEEQYISESGVSQNGAKKKDNYFPRHVVKVIAESPAFLYNNLLPECYNQKHVSTRCGFSYNEDCLLVSALEELKELKLSTSQAAEVISEVLLVVHPQNQVYHRIRNLKKKDCTVCKFQDVKNYFITGELPEIERGVPEIGEQDKLPLLQRDRRGLSQQWITLLSLIEDSPRDKWEERLSKDPVTKSIGRKLSRQLKKEGAKPFGPHFTHSETINRVFPGGTLLVDTPNPNMDMIPVIGANGRVGAIIHIPKLALVAPPAQYPKAGDEAESRGADASRQGEFSQPREALEAGPGETNHPQGASKVNLLGLHHLTRRVQKTPIKQPHVTAQGSPNEYLEKTTMVASEEVSEAAGSVFEVVGKPFDMPELGGAPVGVIDLNSLETPMKKKIFEKAVEQEQHQEEEETWDANNVEVEVEVEYECESPSNSNVILEGTEEELTEDDDEVEELDLRCNEKPEIVTLSSDDEENVKQVNVPYLELVNNGGSSPPKKVDGGNGNGGKSQASTSTPVHSTSSSSCKKGAASGSRGKGDDSDEDGDKKTNGGNKKRPLPKDYNGDEDHQEKDRQKHAMQAPPPPQATASTHSHPTPPQQPQQQQTSSQQQRKARRSPGGKSKVTSKYHVTPPEKMVEEVPTDFEDVADAYMEAYLARVQSATEANHPGIYMNFVQILIDAGEGSGVNQAELYGKVKILLKEYPELLKEFESFLDPTLTRNSATGGSDLTAITRENTVVEIQLIQMVEKYTENCPALKAKIMNKLKSLKEKPNLTEKDMATALEPFFVGNPVMMMAFKQLLPSVYRPQTLTSDQFEVIELDMDDSSPLRGSDTNGNDDLHFEVVKLPNETQVVATNTCPCVCHTKTSDPAFASRSKHCRKCSVKFQDGKIYIHNGRVMRPVSVELTPAKQVAGTSSSSSNNNQPARSAVPASHHEPRTRKDSHQNHHPPPLSSQSGIKSKDFKEKTSVVEPNLSRPPSASSTEKRPIVPSSSVRPPTMVASSTTSPPSEETVVKTEQANVSEVVSSSLSSENDVEVDDWGEEEDETILVICHQESSLQAAWKKIVQKLQNRTLEQVKKRYAELIELVKSAKDEEDQGNW